MSLGAGTSAMKRHEPGLNRDDSFRSSTPPKRSTVLSTGKGEGACLILRVIPVPPRAWTCIGETSSIRGERLRYHCTGKLATPVVMGATAALQRLAWSQGEPER